VKKVNLMKFNQLERKVLRHDHDLYGNSKPGIKSSVNTIEGALTMMKFLICSILTLQILLISVLIYFLSNNHLILS